MRYQKLNKQMHYGDACQATNIITENHVQKVPNISKLEKSSQHLTNHVQTLARKNTRRAKGGSKNA